MVPVSIAHASLLISRTRRSFPFHCPDRTVCFVGTPKKKKKKKGKHKKKTKKGRNRSLLTLPPWKKQRKGWLRNLIDPFLPGTAPFWFARVFGSRVPGSHSDRAWPRFLERICLPPFFCFAWWKEKHKTKIQRLPTPHATVFFNLHRSSV